LILLKKIKAATFFFTVLEVRSMLDCGSFVFIINRWALEHLILTKRIFLHYHTLKISVTRFLMVEYSTDPDQPP